MLRSLIVVLSCLFCLHSIPVGAALETPQFRQVGVGDGLPSSATTGLALDRDGYLWISTRDGLARYDGVGYRVFRHEPGNPSALPGNFVQTVFVDAGNRVWVGIEGQGLSVLDAGRKGFRHINSKSRPLLRSDDVWAITATADGCLWFGTFGGGLYRLDGHDRMTRFLPKAGDARSLPAENVLSLAVDATGVLWVGTSDGVARWTGRDFERLPSDALSGVEIYSLSPERDGSLWIGTDQGLDHRLADGRVQSPAWRTQLPDQGVTSVLRDREGTRWITTRRGLVRERDGVIDPLASTPAGSRFMFLTLEDDEGGLWFATGANGLMRLPAGWRHFAVFGKGEPGLSMVPVRGMSPARDGGAWLVGSGPVIERMDTETGRIQHVLDASKAIPNARFWSVLERSDGSLWLGYLGGLSRLDPATGVFRHWRMGEGSDPLLPGPVQLLAETPDGLLWLASYGGGVQARDSHGAIVHSFTPGDGHGVDSPEQEQMSVGPDGSLWLAGPQGLRRWNQDKGRFDAVQGGPDDHVQGFTFVPPDTLWLHRVGALEAYHWNGAALARFISVGVRQGLPAVESGGLLHDRSGALWLTTARGLLRYDPVGKRLRVYGVRDGLPSQEFQSQPPLMTPQGLVLANTGEGLVLFDPARIHANGVASRLVVDDISLRRGEGLVAIGDGAGGLQMQSEDRDLRVVARLLSFSDPAANQYRFWLHGYDAGWVAAGASGERVFPKLDAGQYRLSVSASNAEGAWSPAQELQLQVQAAWWRRPWAIAGWAVLGLVLLLAIAHRYRQALRNRHADSLREHRRQLSEQGSEAKTRFLATLGHEIRTPMTGVLGMAELLQVGDLAPKQRSQVESIQRAGEHLLRLVNDALDLARIEAGKLPLDELAFDLHALLEEVALLLRPLADARGLRFELQRAPGTPRVVRGDAGRIRQILLNLGGNAIKFTDAGEVALRSAAMPGGLMLEISDTGPGIAPEPLSRLFQRFEQAQGAETLRRHGGSGLGLAICQELALAMAGRIEAHSQVGVGTTFRVSLPLPSAELGDILPEVRRRAPRKADALKILVVEDDETVAEVIVGLLQSLGHAPTLATQALSALTELADARFELAFIDLDLPGLDGFELARIIVSQGQPLAMIALTARADPQAEPLALQSGMHAFMRKPVTSQMLQTGIESVLALMRGPPTGEQATLAPANVTVATPG